MIHFTKMQAAGNDFIVLDNRKEQLDSYIPDCVSKLCDRHFGIGADGIILMEDSRVTDYYMRFYNRDGSLANICGNAGRCIGRYACDKNIAESEHAFETKAGIYEIRQNNDYGITLSMPDTSEPYLDQSLKIGCETIDYHYINTGVPHVVCFFNEVTTDRVLWYGKRIRNHKKFAPDGCNVNFIEQSDSSLFSIRTYERGVEDETLACGTGVVAAALIIELILSKSSPILFRTRSQDTLEVSFEKTNGTKRVSGIQLSGPAHFVFEGYLYLEDFF